MEEQAEGEGRNKETEKRAYLMFAFPASIPLPPQLIIWRCSSLPLSVYAGAGLLSTSSWEGDHVTKAGPISVLHRLGQGDWLTDVSV